MKASSFELAFIMGMLPSLKISVSFCHIDKNMFVGNSDKQSQLLHVSDMQNEATTPFGVVASFILSFEFFEVLDKNSRMFSEKEFRNFNSAGHAWRLRHDDHRPWQG